MWLAIGSRSARAALVSWSIVALALAPWSTARARSAVRLKDAVDGGRATVDTAAELETDDEGEVWSFEAALQLGLSDRWQLLVEAVPFTAESPDDGDGASGVGDTDVSLSWAAFGDAEALASLAVAARIKVPTARDSEIGTRRPDYSGLLIITKVIDELELDLETEYVTFGAPDGEDRRDQLLYTFTVEYGLMEDLAVYAELFGQSAPAGDESRSDAALAGAEMDVPLGDAVTPYASLELDTDGVATYRAGIEWDW